MSPLPGRVIGSSGIADVEDIWPSQRNRRLTAEDVERLATLDPTSRMVKGQLKAMLARSTDPTDPARPLVEALLAVPAQDPPAAAYVNPAKVSTPPGARGDKRPLTPSDIEWLRRLPSDPAKVSPADVTTLARMTQQAASMSDLRLLSAHFEPVWAHHDVAEQQHERRARRSEAQAAKAARTRMIEQLAVAALTPHVQQEVPGLYPLEARDRAALRLRDRWAEQDIALQDQIDANPTWETPAPRPMPGIEGLGGMAAGRERAQRDRERREATPGPFDYAKVIGE